MKRYLRARRGFTAVVTGFSLAGIIIGVAALVVVMGVMAGFRQELYDRLLGFSPHIKLDVSIQNDAQLQRAKTDLGALEGVLASYPILETQSVLGEDIGNGFPVMVRGVDRAGLGEAIVRKTTEGNFEKWDGTNTIALGKKLAERMKARVGDTVRINSPTPVQTFMGAFPKQWTMEVGAIFSLGSDDIDGFIALMPYGKSASFFNFQTANTHVVRTMGMHLENPNEANTLAAQVPPIFKNAESPLFNRGGMVKTWSETHSGFFEALAVERVTMFIILSLIILVAAFNIITGQVMLVGEKRSDIAILRTLGATRGQILRIFLSNGLLLGGIGGAVGAGIGVLILWQRAFLVGLIERATGASIFSGDVYMMETIPAKLETSDVVNILVLVFVLALLASWFPARQAAKLDPVEGLKSA